jgi:hypothetical protein
LKWPSPKTPRGRMNKSKPPFFSTVLKNER